MSERTDDGEPRLEGWVESAGPPPRRPSWPRLLLYAAVLLAVALLAFAAWVLYAPAGTAWAVRRADAALPALAVGRVEGTLGRELVVRRLAFVPPESGTSVHVREARLAVSLAALLRGTVHVRHVEAHGALVKLAPAPPQDEEPFTLDPPIDLVVDRFLATDAVVSSEGAPVARIRRASGAARWTGAGLAVESLDLRAREGAVQLTARVAGDGPYAAEAAGRFRWSLGGTTWAGALDADTAGTRTTVNARLEAPFAARIDGAVEQAAAHPWRATVRVPTFDPRKSLAPDGAMRSLSAQLEARGTRESARLSGVVGVNGQDVRIEELRGRLAAELLHLDALVVRLAGHPGQLRASGRVQLGATPPQGALDAEWRDVVLPEALAGQRLATRGRLRLEGGTNAFRTAGNFAIGPPGRLADVALRARGTPDYLELQQFDVVQRTGRLAARGLVELRPSPAWTVEAEGDGFDPGELIAGWSGDLDLALDTKGTVTDAGPSGHLRLRRLSGTLRGRPLQGEGELEFAAPVRLAGAIELRSGGSRVSVEGRRGESLDATAQFAVASLDDFVPGARGRLDGRVRARGTWPAIAIDGRADARDLALVDDGPRVGRVEAVFAGRDPRAPRGRLDLRAEALEAPGLQLAEVTVRADGTPTDHRLALDATGRPADLRLRLSGSAADGGWRGTIAELGLDLAGAARFTLQQPARVEWRSGAFSVSRSCLADGATSLCAAASGTPDGALEASYSLRELPLALANAVAPDALPGRLRGTVQGEGRVRRTPDGLWYGDASLASPAATLAWGTEAPAALAGNDLDLWRDLDVRASLRGTALDGRASAAIGGEGRLAGEVALSQLDAPTPGVRGRLEANLPTLAPFAPFLPQLEALAGRVQLSAAVTGTLAEPRIEGGLEAAALAAEVPLLGLQLRDGTLRVEAPGDGPIRLVGGVTSGDGRLALEGTATRDGGLALDVGGERVLAADLPAARVIATPQLRLARDAEQLTLTGTVTIPEAAVNLQRLPALVPRARRASPDVIVVNEPARQAAAADTGLPLLARVQVVLGDEVELTGFGLEATVEGQLVVVERPNRAPVGSGEIRVAGTYEAFGQDLEITEGRALFAGTPLDDPRLDVTAVRRVEEITAGLRITGTGRRPEVAVFSDPTLGETEALAYLVTGRPLNAIGTGGSGEGDLMANAAQSLGTAAGGLLAERLGRRLGVDEAGIVDSEELGGSAFTVGQYLSPRLYLGYGVGLFEPGQVVTIRYALSEALSIEAVRGEEATRAGVEYRIER